MGGRVSGPFRRRRLPLKVSYRGLELSAESEELLDEAMVRLDLNDPDEAVKASLRLLLQQPLSDNPPTRKSKLTVWKESRGQTNPSRTRLRSIITGGLRATANRWNTHADAVVGICKNPDDCFTQVDEVGSSKTTRTVGGHEQGEFVTATGRDPVALQEAKTINNINYALTATQQAEQLAHASVLQSAMATPRFEREVRAIEKIRTAAGYKAQPQVH
jgi:hypothetical protein